MQCISTLERYNGSLFKMLSETYPEFEWLPWRFDERLPHEYWNDKNNQRSFMDWVAKQLNYNNREDWYNISHKVKNSKKLRIFKKEGF
jgi:hypothetical protein